MCLSCRHVSDFPGLLRKFNWKQTNITGVLSFFSEQVVVVDMALELQEKQIFSSKIIFGP